MNLWDDKRNGGIWQTYSRAVKEEKMEVVVGEER